MRLKLDPTSPSGISTDEPKQAAPRQGNGYVVRDITGTLTAGSNISISGNGTTSSPYQITSTGGTGGASDATTSSKGIVQLAGDLAGTAAAPTTPTALHKTTDETKTGSLTFNGSTQRNDVELTSNFSGGYNTSDSTSRLTLHSYQKAQLNNDGLTNTSEAHYGEVLRIQMEKQQAKGAIAFRENYLGAAIGPRTVAWLVAHGEANDSTPANPIWHNHFSVEIPDENGALQTALEFPFGYFNVPNSFGIPLTDQYVRAVRTLIAAGNLVIESPTGNAENIYFHSDTYNNTATRRWGLQTDSTTEAGSNAGSDFRINRYGDSGSFVETALFMKRSTGQIGIGGLTSTTSPAVAAKLDVTAAGSYHTLQAVQTTTSAVNYAALSLQLGNVSNRLITSQVIGDAIARYTQFGDGKMEWGDGTNARDTNLYRGTANVLQTDDSIVAVRLTAGNTTSQSAAIYGENDGTNSAGRFKSTADGTATTGVVTIEGFSTAKRGLDYRVIGDTTSRLRIDSSAGSGNGTLNFGDGTTVDVNLYRSAANVLKTDDKFVAAGGLQINTSSTTGYVWTATDTAGNGSWQVAPSSTGDMAKSVYDAAGINQQLVGTTATQTLTNKTLTAPQITGAGAGVATVQFANTGTNTTATIPSEGVSNINLVTAAAVQTLTNKTITTLTTGFTTTAVNLTLSASHQVVEVTAGVTITLPTAASITGRRYDIINSSASSVTVGTTSSQTIGNVSAATTATITTGNSLTVVSNGSNWRVIQ